MRRSICTSPASFLRRAMPWRQAHWLNRRRATLHRAARLVRHRTTTIRTIPKAWMSSNSLRRIRRRSAPRFLMAAGPLRSRGSPQGFLRRATLSGVIGVRHWSRRRRPYRTASKPGSGHRFVGGSCRERTPESEQRRRKVGRRIDRRDRPSAWRTLRRPVPHGPRRDKFLGRTCALSALTG